MTSASPSTQLVHPAVLHAMLQARADELAARKAERQEARSRRARSRGGRGFVAILGAVSLLLVGALSALAVHNLGLFELDENAVASVAPGDDWENVYNNTDSAVESVFVPDGDDFSGGIDVPAGLPSDDTTYFTTGGSKDVNDINQWMWQTGDVAPDKDEILNAYAAAYLGPDGADAGTDPDLILYFGLDRFANNGDAQVGFWFFQSTHNLVGGGTFSGVHDIGDILVLSHFTQGGVVDTIEVYEWVGPPDADNLALVATGAECAAAHALNAPCATVNDNTETAPWPYVTKFPESGESENDFAPGTFYEGGINASDLGLDIGCGGTFLAETRSSQSLDAQLKDFALGDFDLCGTKSGTKYEDPDGDGDLTDGVPLDGWTINLYSDDGDTVGELDVNDTFLDSAVTGDGTWADGYYEFPDLFPGDYIVCEVLQTDWFQSAPNPGTADCSFDPTLGEAGYAFTIEQGVDETGNDFGNFQQGSKSGTKFSDPNGDGDLTDGTGLEGWTINVYADDGDGSLSAAEYAAGAAGTDTTDVNGDYEITGLDPGDYIACEVLQTGWTQSFPSSGADCTTASGATDLAQWGFAFTVTSGSSEEDNDFGNFEQGTKSGTKYEDENANGSDDGVDEAGLDGWTILAFADDGDGDLSQAEYDAGAADNAVTAAGGAYELSLDPGDYIVCEELLSSAWTQSEPGGTACDGIDTGLNPALADGGYAITVTSGSEETGNDFGNFQQGSKSGTKFEDPNADGDLTDGTGLEGWTINVYADDGDGSLSAAEYAAGAAGTDTTDVNGDYEITGLDPGDYIACEVLQTDWFQSAPSSGADCTTDSGATDLAQWGFAFTVTSGSSEEDNDFGNFQQGSKSGTKFSDPNGDGDLTDGTGLEGWTINVYADDGDGSLSAAEYAAGAAGTDTTDVNGDYEITGLDPGDYIACEVLQTGWTQSFPSSGADCTTASGATDLAQWGFAFTVTSGSSEEDNDFGNFQPLLEGCTPGFWKTHTDLWDSDLSDNGGVDLVPSYDPDTLFDDVFGAGADELAGLDDGATLEDALNVMGGGKKALARHGAAAVLNADSSIDYPYDVATVIDIVQDGLDYPGGDPDGYTLQEALAALSTANELGCPFGAGGTTASTSISLAGFDLVSALLVSIVAGSRHLRRRRLAVA